jgi:hypothetical protein
LVSKIQQGKATAADLTKGGATWAGVRRLRPGALLRGGSFGNAAHGGPLAVADIPPSVSGNGFGFRCAR